MKVVETKIYQIEMTDKEKKEIKNAISILEEIMLQFNDKDVFYIDYNGDIGEMDTSHFEYVLDSLDALIEM